VLDNSCVLFLSNMWSGWKHDNMKLPVVMAGGLGGTLQTGRALDYLYDGDDNRNARVDVSYRKQGETQWKQGLPLLRLQGERIYQNQGVFDVVSPNMFAGSVLDLEQSPPGALTNT